MKASYACGTRILFDEAHSETWTVSSEVAAQINPTKPANSSYARAAKLLKDRGFTIERNINRPIETDLLSGIGVLVLLHPCDSRWEKATSDSSPIFEAREIEAIGKFLENGGGLVVVSEYEHGKYGSNVNDLLAKAGLAFQDTTVSDALSNLNHPNWVRIELDPRNAHRTISGDVHDLCFYRSGSIGVTGGAESIVTASSNADPPRAVLVASSSVGAGRVVAVADSDLFGDEFIGDFDHSKLWLSLLYWAAVPSKKTDAVTTGGWPDYTEWVTLRESVNILRRLQLPNGSVPSGTAQEEGRLCLKRVKAALTSLKPAFPHQAEYFGKTLEAFDRWEASSFGEPNFLDPLTQFHPELERGAHDQMIALFPMYTPNGSQDVRFEALSIQLHWPKWLASIEEEEAFRNPKFVPGRLRGFTEGYASECAVLFPESVSPVRTADGAFGIIFCDREARRFQRVVRDTCEALRVNVLPQLEFLRKRPTIHTLVLAASRRENPSRRILRWVRRSAVGRCGGCWRGMSAAG